MGKHRVPTPPGPRHLTRLRLSMLVRALELERAELGSDGEQHEWLTRREARLAEVGGRR